MFKATVPKVVLLGKFVQTLKAHQGVQHFLFAIPGRTLRPVKKQILSCPQKLNVGFAEISSDRISLVEMVEATKFTYSLEETMQILPTHIS